MQFPSQCKNSTDRYGSTIYTVFCSAVLCKQQKSSKLWGSFLPWCRVCTIVKFILKGSYRCGEPKNVISQSVQIPHRPVRVNKLSHVLQRRIWPAIEIFKISWLPISMVPCLQQCNVYIARKLRVWRAQKCNFLVSAKTEPTVIGQQTIRVLQHRIGQAMEIF